MTNNAVRKRRGYRTGLARGRTILFVLYCTLLLIFQLRLFSTFLLGVMGGTVPHTSGDFVAFSIGGYIIRHANAAQLYDLDTQARAQMALLGPEAQASRGMVLSDGLALYVYPPFVAWMFAGLAALSPTQAYLLWTGVNVLLLVVTVYALTSLPGLATRRTRLLAGLAVLAFFPTLVVFIKGQLSFLILALLSAAFLSLRRGREGLAGLWLGLGLVKPQLVIVPVIVLAYQRRWRAVLAFAGVALLLAVISIAVVGPAGLLDYIHLLWQVGRETTHDSLVHPVYMLNWRGMVTRGAALLADIGIRTPQASVLGSYGLLSLLSLGLLLHAWRRPWPDSRAELESLWALTVVVGMLVSPHLHIYDLSLLILVGLLVMGTPQISQTGWRGLLGIGHVAPFLSFPIGRVVQARVCSTVMVVLAGALWYHVERSATLSQPDVQGDACLRGGI